MPHSQDPERRIESYLIQIRSGLKGIPEDQIADIVRELRTHIVERAESSGTLSPAAVEDALLALGRPDQVTSLYVIDNVMARAQGSRMPWTVLHGIFFWATMNLTGFLVFLMCLIGYAIGTSFFLAALLKPFVPSIGLWIGDRDRFFLVLGQIYPNRGGHELLGWTLVPIGCALGGGTILLTTHFALWCIRKFREQRRLRGFGKGTASAGSRQSV